MARIVRQEMPSGYGNNYNKTRPNLRRDFGRRCAYCMLHDGDIGASFFSIDHFRPQSRGGTHAYTNLYYACMVCNRRKYYYWPSAAEVSQGIEFCDPCAEWDYGEHLLEDNNALNALTSKGGYHLGKIDLNRAELIEKRSQRESLLALVGAIEDVLESEEVPESLAAPLRRKLATHQSHIDECIPLLPLRKHSAHPIG